MPYKIVVDTEACEGYAKCQAAAPDLFRLDDDLPVVILNDSPGDGERARVEKAIRVCPRAALTVVER